MDKEQEEIIVKSFFAKRFRKRVIFELFSTKKRIEALSRLCHRAEMTLIQEFMFEIPKPNSEPLEIEALLKRYGAGNTCYAISWNKEIDGKHLPLRIALKRAVGFGMPSLISCIPGRLAYFEAEQVSGPPPRYILKREV